MYEILFDMSTLIRGPYYMVVSLYFSICISSLLSVLVICIVIHSNVFPPELEAANCPDGSISPRMSTVGH
jgi:hypothetical protein